MDIHELLHQAQLKKASDLHLVCSIPPVLRIDGSLQPMAGYDILNAEDIYGMFSQLTTSEDRNKFSEMLELDFAYNLPDGGRLRCNACRQRGVISLSARLLPAKIPTIDELGLPGICKDLIERPRGLILLTGPTGSGKSTTLAAMLEYINARERRYVVTIEDPIEYVYKSNKSCFSQRELSVDTQSFAMALKHVLRQDPDIILVGEMRDLETAAAVLTVAETGHLVLSTGHAPSSAQSIERIVDLFPPYEREMSQARLASVLLGVLCQALVPRIDGGRVAAVEIMLANPPVKNLIREGKVHLLPNTIRTHGNAGMQMLDDALVKLYKAGVISWSTVRSFCQDVEETSKLVGNSGANSGVAAMR